MVLGHLAGGQKIADSGQFAEEHGIDHQQLMGVLNSLDAAEMITMQVRGWLRCCRRCYCRVAAPAASAGAAAAALFVVEAGQAAWWL